MKDLIIESSKSRMEKKKPMDDLIIDKVIKQYMEQQNKIGLMLILIREKLQEKGYKSEFKKEVMPIEIKENTISRSVKYKIIVDGKEFPLLKTYQETLSNILYGLEIMKKYSEVSEWQN